MGIVLLTGASGFVGSHLPALLGEAGFTVRCATRDPERAARESPGQEWTRLDVDRPETMEPAMRGAEAAVYLVHEMSDGPGYESRESDAARAFAEAAARAGVQRIVYLGGVAPRENPSRHLKSRLETGEILRAGTVPVFELRASMIIGRGSASWQVVRDLAARLPAMLLPRWLGTRTRPVAIDDVALAITAALGLPLEKAGVWELPGPEVLTVKQILFRVAALRGTRPISLSVPVLTPRLSSYWLKLVTGANYHVARELVEGLSSDLLPTHRVLWDEIPGHRLVPFDEAARRAMEEERDAPFSLPREVLERLVALVSRRARHA